MDNNAAHKYSKASVGTNFIDLIDEMEVKRIGGSIEAPHEEFNQTILVSVVGKLDSSEKVLLCSSRFIKTYRFIKAGYPLEPEYREISMCEVFLDKNQALDLAAKIIRCIQVWETPLKADSHAYAPEKKETVDTPPQLSQRLKLWRKSLKLTQAELSEQMRASKSSIQGYELGKRTPGGDALTAFTKMGLNINWLLTGKGEMTNG